MFSATTDGRRAAVIGSPVAHSLSPVLHNACFEALGLRGWEYGWIDCPEDGVAELVRGLGPEWAGLSVTMPDKRAALAVATAPSRTAVLVGAANTLVPFEGGWRAECTDVDGVVGALRAAAGFTSGERGLVLGAGGTATAALVGLASVGVRSVALVVRDVARAGEAVACAERAGVELDLVTWDSADFGALASEADVLVSTVPPAATEPVADLLASTPVVLDVIYHPWPTPLALAVRRLGREPATGLDMLLHQAFGQAELFTGLPAPREAMRAALRAATGNLLPLPV
ncbi:shikimate dehydrogenase [Actinosynnema pretiosum subsp. pretiosum]|uniref:Shikimate-5-dehydrogenase n=2 Tax=Actinosynnema TaxID=40566 RepID=C6W911_ACTMD|nr:shikimate dehydrogenase [Actinosynnema mirum]ACU39083.1 shikimate-5-dehydrogenase [Actinosynnema mirum DSM 43827]QUF03435.1 shikimate dehydrogenase [Actinosynnema pretiosum subsp. pretiosum]